MSLPDGLTEYADAEQYDRDNTWSADDDFYLELAREIGGPVLDLACGTGRLTRAFAEAGLETSGLEITPQMLARARALDVDQRVTWIHDDARTMQLGRTFKLITMTGHSFQHMLSDSETNAMLQRVHEHLEPEGRFIFETRNYDAKTYGKTEVPSVWKTTTDGEGRLVDLLVGGVLDEDRVETLTFVDVVRETGEQTVSISLLRYVTLGHLNELLTDNGFVVELQYGNWDRSAVGPDQPEIITICRPV